MTKLPKTLSRIPRLLRLIVLMQNGEVCTVASLREALGVSRRTLFRDLKALEDAGIPASYQYGIGYTMRRGPMVPLDVLTAKEILGLIMLGKLARGHVGQPMINHGLAAIYRSVSASPVGIREACKDLMSHISIQQHGGTVPQSVQEHFMMLMRLIDEESVCRVEMSDLKDTGKDSICFLPRTLVLEDRGWITVGESVLHNAPVKINLADITSIEKRQF